MRTISLGRCGINVSAVGLGGIQFSKIGKRQVQRIIGTARDAGINLLETASGYWDSEEKMGYALRGKRGDFVLASKAGVGTGKEFTKSIEQSLERLGTDFIDIYQLHGVDKLEALKRALARGGAVQAAKKAIRQGKIGSLGISSHSMDLALHVLKLDLFDTLQYPISLINTEVPRSGMLGQAKAKNVGLIAMKPLGGGRLGNPRLALGYIYRHPRVAPIVGVETPEQVKQLARIAEHPPKMGAREFAAIRRLRRTVGTTFCRACRYCEPCPQGISIYRVLYLPIFLKQFDPKLTLGKGIPPWLAKTAECTACRKCESRCPFHLHIVDGLKESLALAERVIRRIHARS